MHPLCHMLVVVDKVAREEGAAIPARATARVPTPLRTAPALTMTTKGSSLATDHSKGGGGAERGGDPCGRPGGMIRVREAPPFASLDC